MSRDTKILIASGAIQLVVAGVKSGASTPDAMLETAKTELFPLIVNIGSLALLFKLIKG